ncbi:MAG: hypothetical protein ABIM29_05800 [candidate division WOR-3 bacterium]
MYDNNKILEIIKYYFDKGSLRKTAKKFGIHYNTLWKWVKKYKRAKDVNDFINYRKPWNRIKGEIEQRVINLKENYPLLSLRKAKRILEKEGIELSVKCIWRIWKRAGFCGFEKNSPTSRFTEYISVSKEDKILINRAKIFLNNGEIGKAANIINSLCFCSEGGLLKKIPDNYLSKKRLLEKYTYSIFEVPMTKYYKVMKKLRNYFYKKGLYYSSLRALLQEMIALEWLCEPEKIIKISSKFLKYFKNINDKNLKFHFLISRGIAFAHLGEFRRVKEILKECKKFAIPNPEFYLPISSLYSFIYENNNAIKNIHFVSKKNDTFYLYLSSFIFNAGDYVKLSKILKRLKIDKEREYLKDLILSARFLIKGEINKSQEYLIRSLKGFKRSRFKDYIFSSSLIYSQIYCFLGKYKEGLSIIRKLLPFLRKYKLKRDLSIASILLSGKIEKKFLNYPLIKILYFLNRAKKKESYYYKAMRISKKYKINGYFHRFILFYPEIILNLIKKGKKTYLPKGVLRSPVFNKEKIVYNIKFLKGFYVYKNQKRIKNYFTKKEKAFIIYLALKISEPGKKINLDEVVSNFWKKNGNKNLTRLLYKIRKKLKIMGHQIEINRKENVLINKGIYFITDYFDFETSLNRANAFLKVDNWEFAKKEFFGVLKLIKNRPLEKIYDRWSEDLRTEIIMKYNEVIKKFKMECIKRKDYKWFYKFASNELFYLTTD